MPALALPAFWGAVSAGAAGGAGIYAAKKAGQANKEASQVTAQSNQAAIDEQKRQDAQQKEEFDAQQAMLAKQWDAQQALKAPYRAAGANALSNIGSILGVDFGAGGGGNSAAPSGPALPGSASDLKAMIDSGMDPQQAAAAFNQKFGRTTGNEAKFYGADVHGTPTIGLPDAYLSLEPNGWSITQRGGGGAPRPAAMTSGGMMPTAAPMLGNNLAAPYVPEIPITALMGR